MPFSFKIITSLCFLHEQVKLVDLMKDGMWRKDLLQVLFCPRDVELILQIPLSPLNRPDTWIWHYTPAGQFSVASAYRVVCEAQSNLESSSDRQLHLDSWKLLWSCNLPPKELVFAWKLLYFDLLT